MPKYLKFGVLGEVTPVVRSYLSLFSQLTSYYCNLSSIQLYCFLSQPKLAVSRQQLVRLKTVNMSLPTRSVGQIIVRSIQ